jgi:hypothetical protein
LSCLDAISGLPWVCSSFGLANALAAFIAYIMASQSTYLVLPKRTLPPHLKDQTWPLDVLLVMVA